MILEDAAKAISRFPGDDLRPNINTSTPSTIHKSHEPNYCIFISKTLVKWANKKSFTWPDKVVTNKGETSDVKLKASEKHSSFLPLRRCYQKISLTYNPRILKTIKLSANFSSLVVCHFPVLSLDITLGMLMSIESLSGTLLFRATKAKQNEEIFTSRCK